MHRRSIKSLDGQISNEMKVGFLLVGTLVLTVVFAWIMGAQNPFRKSLTFHLTYHFAGGIDVGSPVRVAGIKVGKVEKIEFFVPETNAVNDEAHGEIKSEEIPLKGTMKTGVKPTENSPVAVPSAGKKKILTPLRVTISLTRDVAEGIRHDSQFFINLAGIIGERYIEVTPGTQESPKVQDGETLRGVDPPRIDQLISQSFDLAGKIKEVIEENEGDITKSIKLLYDLSANLNKTLQFVERSKIFKTDLQLLINNLIEITTDVKVLTSKTNSAEGKKTLELLHKLLWRLEPLEAEQIRKFFQKEGIRTRLF